MAFSLHLICFFFSHTYYSHARTHVHINTYNNDYNDRFVLQMVAAISSESLAIFATMADAFMDLLSSIVMMWAARQVSRPNLTKYPAVKNQNILIFIILFFHFSFSFSSQKGYFNLFREKIEWKQLLSWYVNIYTLLVDGCYSRSSA